MSSLEWGYWIALIAAAGGLGVLAIIQRHLYWRDYRLRKMARSHLTDLQSDLQKIARKL